MEEKIRLPRLNLPEMEVDIREHEGVLSIYDALRQKYVALTPEEWVRQHFTMWLINHRGFPRSFMANEVGLTVNGRQRRADTVVFTTTLQPLMVIEYKNAAVRITQKVFDQIVRYNMVYNAPYLAVSNGMNHYCCKIDFENHSYSFLREVPNWHELSDLVNLSENML